MTANPNDDPDRAGLAAEYVLRVLPAEEEAEVRERVATDPDFARQTRQWQDIFSAMDHGFQPVAPPSRVKQALDARLFEGEVRRRTPLFSSLAFWRVAALGATALAAVSIMAPLVTPPVENRISVATLAGEQPGTTFSVVFNPADGGLRVIRAADDPLAGNDFELWAVAEDAAPVSLGIIGRDGTVAGSGLPQDLMGAEAGAVTLAISLEPEGGSPTGQPTGPVVSAGALRDL